MKLSYCKNLVLKWILLTAISRGGMVFKESLFYCLYLIMTMQDASNSCLMIFRILKKQRWFAPHSEWKQDCV
jgi:hypothetical protein